MSALFFIVGGFASGVLLRSLSFLPLPAILFVAFLGILLCAAWFLFERRPYMLLALFCISLALGGARALTAETPLPEPFASEVGERVSYDGVIAADPDMRDTSQRTLVRVEKEGGETLVLMVAPRHPTPMVGDRVRVWGTLELPEAFLSEGGRVFRYDKYLERDGARFLLSYAGFAVEEPAPWYSVPAAFAHIKRAFIGGLQSGLPEPYASLSGGIVVGGKSGLGAELQDDFIRSGLIHIIVLSGYNVMIVAEWVIIGLALLRLPRRWAALAGGTALLIFVGIAGASSTAVRASLMALVALYARASGRTYDAGRALLVVALAMLVWNPLLLAFDPGFGLSVTATAGLIWFAPALEQRLAFIRSAFLRDALATTLAAQMAVLPLLLYFTGTLSLVSVPANIAAALATPIAMGFSALAGIAGALFDSFAPLLGILFSFPAYLLSAYLIFVARLSASLPLAAVILPAFSFSLVLLSYGALGYLGYRIARISRSSTTPQLRAPKNASM